MGKNSKPYYKDKKLAATGFGFENIKGHQFSTKFEAKLTSFFIILWGRLLHGFPVIVGNKFWASAIAMWPFIFVRAKDGANTKTLNHEMIHIRQQFELYLISIPVSFALFFFGMPDAVTVPLFLLPYTLYLFEIIIRFIIYGFNIRKAYYFHSMESEARRNAENVQYLMIRKPFAWIKYLW